MNLKYFKNIGENEYEILIHGEIGKVVIGSDIAAEIHVLNRMGATLIKERINTVGGTVTDAYSIVSANLASNATIHTINEGIADSSGSWILASGNKRSGFDFTTVFLHNPSYKGKSIEEIQDSKLKNELMIMRDSIVTILSNNTGKSIEEVQAVMDANTRMSANDAKDFGIIDEVITSKRTPELVENMSMVDIMNVCHELNSNDNIKIDNKMKTVLNVLNLSEDASEASAVSAVKAISNKVELAEEKADNLTKDIQNLNTTIAGKDADIAEKDAKIVELEGIVNASKVAAIKNVVDTAISSGKFVEENRDSLTKQATTLGVENFTEMIDMVKLPQANAVNQVMNNSGDGKKATKDETLAAEYQELADKDPAKLAEIKNLEPARFELMFNAWNQ